MIEPSAETGDALRLRWAAERTLLAWVRTSLALFGLGFVMARLMAAVDGAGGGFVPSLRHYAATASLAVGVVFVCIGAVATAAAGLRYRAYVGDTTSGGGRSAGSSVSFATSIVVAALGVFLALSLVVVSI